MHYLGAFLSGGIMSTRDYCKSGRHPRWNPNKMFSSNGYVKLRVGVGHPCADTYGYAYEHLVVWMASGKPRPLPNREIHHINGFKDDNRIGNLEVVRKRHHMSSHAAVKPRNGNGQFEPKDVF